jgi:glycogen debranching enzyme
MVIILTKDLSQYSYILAGKKAFFHRFCDTGFKTKWTGLWYKAKKFIEYFAFKINDEWLSPSNCISFTHSEIDACHRFLLNGMDVKEFLFIPENLGSLVCILTLENSSKEQKKVNMELDLAANIREREENWHDRTYETKVQKNKVIVNSAKGYLSFGSSPFGTFELNKQYKDHYPGELQRCFIPGTYRINLILEPKSKQDIFFIFSCGNDESESLANYEYTEIALFSLFLEKEKIYQELISNAKFESGIIEIDELFSKSVINLEKLGFDSDFGFGYFAGYPWFTQFWGRDLGWILPAVIDYGNFEAAKETLRTLTKFQKNGAIPNIVYPNGKTDYNSIDSTPLWIIALYHYIFNSGDILFLYEVEENLIKALEWCKENADKDGFLELEGKTTWMDTLERPKAVEVQAFWIEALKCTGDLLRLMGREKISREIEEEAREIEQNFEKKFWNEEEKFYFDCIRNGRDKTKTINSIFPLVFGISQNRKKVIEKIENDEFSTRFGVRTISKNEQIYNPAGYHTGSSWGWLVALVACAEFKNNKPKKGIDYLKILFNNLNQSCLGAIGEAWNSENGSRMLLKDQLWEEGSCLQGWSSALVIRCIDEFMLGIKVNALTKTIIVSPSLLDGMRIVRRKRIGSDFVDLFFERIGNELKITYKSKNKEEYKIIVSPKV